MTSRNWSTATLLARILEVIEDEYGADANKIFLDPLLLDPTLASDLIIMLKDRVIADKMKGRI
jgi:hypothetical protein